MPQTKKRSRISRSDFEKIARFVSFSDEAIATYKKVSPERARFIRQVTAEAFKAIEAKEGVNQETLRGIK